MTCGCRAARDFGFGPIPAGRPRARGVVDPYGNAAFGIRQPLCHSLRAQGKNGYASTHESRTPQGVCCHAEGNLFIADNYHYAAPRTDTRTGLVTTFAENGSKDLKGDGEPAAFPRSPVSEAAGPWPPTPRATFSHRQEQACARPRRLNQTYQNSA